MITEIIPKQGFEQVGEKIGAILTLELAAQKTLQGITDPLNAYHERITPYDKGEGTIINVMLDGAKYDNFTEFDAHGDTSYNIDVYGTGKTKGNARGDTLSAKSVQRYLGWCRYILQSTKYKTLDFPPGLIAGTYVDSLQMFDVQDVQDAASVKMGRLAFRVRIQESQEAWKGVDIMANFTEVKLQETEQGFKYNLINS